MGLLLLGMNTALTTTATAIVCYFFFTFFFHRLTDLQTWVSSQVERGVLIHMVPEFTFEPDAINHQTKLLVEDIRGLVGEMRQGLGGIDGASGRRPDRRRAAESGRRRASAVWTSRTAALEASLVRLDELRQILVEGFRLNR